MPDMIRRTRLAGRLFLLTCLLLPLLTAMPAAADPAERTAQLDALFSKACPATAPGAAVLVQLGDETLLRKGYGLAHLELDVAIAPDMIFRLGSITKQFTAAAVLMLAAEGRIDLDAPVVTYLPDFPEPGARVTIHQLLTHTSGIHSYTDDPEFWETMALDRSLDDLISTWQDTALEFDPGDAWRYSNSGYVMLGKVIEVASGQTYADFMNEHVFQPLGLTHTLYGDPAAIVPRRVAGYDVASDGFVNTSYISMTLPHAAGALLSNVDDMLTWGRALLASDTLLDADGRRRLLAPAALNDGRPTGYACGLAIQQYDGHAVISHGGGINGFTTYVIFLPDVDLTVAVLSNNTGLTPGPGQLAQQAVGLALGVPMDQRPHIDLDADVLDEYAGLYRLGQDPQQTRTLRVENGTLTSQRGGGSRRVVRFTEPDVLYFEESFTTGRILRDDAGAVTGVRIAAQMDAEETWQRTDEPIPAERAVIELKDLSLLDALVGRYELAPGFIIEIRRDGDALWAEATGQPALQIRPESETRWFPEEVDATFEFVGQEDGQADSLVLHQGGQQTPAPRVESSPGRLRP